MAGDDDPANVVARILALPPFAKRFINLGAGLSTKGETMKHRLPVWCAPLGLVTLFLSAGANYALSYLRSAANSALTPDKGKFRILQQGNEVGTEEFDLQPSGNAWVMNDQTVIRVGSAETHTSGQLRISADGTPQHYTWSSQGEKKASGTVEFDNGTAKTSLNVSGAKGPAQQDSNSILPGWWCWTIILRAICRPGDNVRLTAKGTQSFPPHSLLTQLQEVLMSSR